MRSRAELLAWEVGNIVQWLSHFECAPAPRVGVLRQGHTLYVDDFPLPDGYAPERVDLAMKVSDYPVEPPKGLYLLAEATNGALLSRLRQRFNVFADTAFHGAPAVEGSQWICVGYLEGWRFNPGAPHRGDNIQKMLAEFWRVLEESQ